MRIAIVDTNSERAKSLIRRIKKYGEIWCVRRGVLTNLDTGVKADADSGLECDLALIHCRNRSLEKDLRAGVTIWYGGQDGWDTWAPPGALQVYQAVFDDGVTPSCAESLIRFAAARLEGRDPDLPECLCAPRDVSALQILSLLCQLFLICSVSAGESDPDVHEALDRMGWFEIPEDVRDHLELRAGGLNGSVSAKGPGVELAVRQTVARIGADAARLQDQITRIVGSGSPELSGSILALWKGIDRGDTSDSGLVAKAYMALAEVLAEGRT